MKEKRFVINNDIGPDVTETYEIQTIHDKDTNNFYYLIDVRENIKSLIEELNHLNEEKERLSMRFNGLGLEYEGLQEENKQLRKELEKYKHTYND